MTQTNAFAVCGLLALSGIALFASAYAPHLMLMENRPQCRGGLKRLYSSRWEALTCAESYGDVHYAVLGRYPR